MPRPARSVSARRRALLFESLEHRALLATAPVAGTLGAEPVHDINTTPSISGSTPQSFVDVNGVTFFTAASATSGLDLWRTDGGEAGTWPVKDIAPTAVDRPRYLVNVNGRLVFNANDGAYGKELWSSDGTAAGTVLLKDIYAGLGASDPRYLTNVNGTFFFVADDGTRGRELWKTDGTVAGTTLVKDIWSGAGDSSPRYLTNLNGTLFFRANDNSSGEELWKSDGTAGGTVLVKNIRPGSAASSPQNLAAVNDTLFFQATDGVNGYELWCSDGTAAGTSLVANIRSGSASSSPSVLTNLNGTLLFIANDGVHGGEVWRSNGTAGGTELVKDIWTDSSSSSINRLTDVNGTAFFAATDGIAGIELWRTDGTTEGTTLVRNIRAGSAASNPFSLTNVNGTLFFNANDGNNGSELWKSDGTESGTLLVRDISEGAGNSAPRYLANANGTLLFGANDGIHGYELWRSDGSAGGTVLIKDIQAGTGHASPRYLTNLNGMLLYQAAKNPATTEGLPRLWRSDESGTSLVKDVDVAAASLARPKFLTNVNGTVYFNAIEGNNGYELWRSDGTADGTTLVTNIALGANSANPTNFAQVNGTLFFQANDGTHGAELWRSNGTAEGTALVKDLIAGSIGGAPHSLMNVSGTLYFFSTSNAGLPELWRSDGTTDGTLLLNRWSGQVAPWMTNVNGTLFFQASESGGGAELWRSDGITSSRVKDIRPGSTGSVLRSLTNVNGDLYFVANDGVNGDELWRSDGTESGTSLVKDIVSGASGSSPDSLINVNGTLYFSAREGAHGSELWRSDGTAAGTVLVEDIYAGLGGSNPSQLMNFNGTLVFAANDYVHGLELWRSDGTEVGTCLLADVAPLGSSFPSWPTVVGNELFFAALTDESGEELWKVSLQTDNELVCPEDAPLHSFLSATDADGDPVTFAIETGPSHGTLTFFDPATGAYVYTPDLEYSGSDTFTFTASDGTLVSEMATVNIAITLVNDRPVAHSNSVNVDEDSEVDITLSGSDAEGDAFTFVVLTQPQHGTLSGTAPDLVYTPFADYHGPDSFTFAVQQGAYTSAATTIALAVAPTNDAPTANNGSAATDDEDPVGITLSGADIDGDAISYTVVDPPEHGVLSGTAPDLVYTPDVNYHGPDSFTFRARDSVAESELATINITVNDVNDAPQAEPAALEVDEDEAANVVLAGSDREGDTLTYVITAAPSHGVLSGDAPNLTYTPDDNYHGPDSFSFKVNDGALDSAPATVGIAVDSVNDAPAALAGNLSTDEDTPASDMLTGDDVDAGDTLTYSIVASPSHGVLTSFDANTGEFTYAPDLNYEGEDSFTFKASDGSLDSGPATVTLVINAINDAPSASDDSLEGVEDMSLDGTLPASDLDVGDALTWSVVTGPSHGVLTSFNASSGEFTYAPHPDYNGADSFTFVVSDGKVDSNVATLSISLEVVNDAPSLNAAVNPTLVSIPEDVANPVSTQVASLLAGAIGDVDAAALQGIAVTAASNVNGIWQYSLDNGSSWIGMDNPSTSAALLLPGSARVRFTPKANFNGVVKLWYCAWDQTEGTPGGTLSTAGNTGGSQSLSVATDSAALTVTPINDAPVLDNAHNPTLASIPEDAQDPAGTLASSLLAGVSDVDAGAAKGIAVYTASTFNGLWQYKLGGGKWQEMGAVSQTSALLLPAAARVRLLPKADFNGTVKLYFRAWDQTQGTAAGRINFTGNTGGAKSCSTASETADLVVSPVNDKPVVSLSGTVGYTRDSAAITLAPFAGVQDIDSHVFDGGRLRVWIAGGASSSNRLAIGAGFTIDANNNVLQGTTVIGKRTANGFGTNELIVAFRPAASKAIVQQLVRAITFKTVGGLAGQRTIAFSVSDGDGGASDEVAKLVNVT